MTALKDTMHGSVSVRVDGEERKVEMRSGRQKEKERVKRKTGKW